MNRRVLKQIEIMCRLCSVPCDDRFARYVYSKNLKMFSGEILKKLKEEYNARYGA